MVALVGGGWRVAPRDRRARGQYGLRRGREGHGLGQVELDDAAAARHDLGQLDLLAALDDVAVAHLQYLAVVDDVVDADARAIVVPVSVQVGLQAAGTGTDVLREASPRRLACTSLPVA